MRNRDGSGESEIANYPTPLLFTWGESGLQNAPFGGNGHVVNMGQTSVFVQIPAGECTFTNSVTSNPIAWTSLNSPFAVTTGSGSLKIANLGGQPNVYYHTANGNPESQGVIFRSTLVGQTGTPGSNWVLVAVAARHYHRHGVGRRSHQWKPGDHLRHQCRHEQLRDLSDAGLRRKLVRLQNVENLMLGINPLGGQTFLNRVTLGRNTGTLNFGSYWQPSLFKFNPLDPTTISGRRGGRWCVSLAGQRCELAVDLQPHQSDVELAAHPAATPRVFQPRPICCVYECIRRVGGIAGDGRHEGRD